MSMKLNTFTLTETLLKLKDKEISHADLYKDMYGAINACNTDLHIYLTVDKNAGLHADKLLNTPLGGVPIAIKDNFLTQGMRTTAASRVLEHFIPPFNATVINKIHEKGGVVIGKTNMDAWAHGSSTETSDFGLTKNPRNPKHLPGGSSGGSAAAVASDTCIVAIGSETAGSIRQPAAWCGVVGLKPTYGRVSRAGVVAMASSTDSPGPIGKTVEDCALMLNCIAGKDQYDATTSPRRASDFVQNMKKGIKGMKVGMCYTDLQKIRGTKTVDAVKKAGLELEKLGAIVEPIPLSDSLQDGHIFNPEYAIAVYTIVQRSEVSSNLAGYNGIRYDSGRSNFGAEAKRRIMLGTFTLSKGYADKYYVKAQKVRSLYRENFKQLFSTYDVLISPTSPGFALPLGATEGNPMFGELEDMLLEPSSITGLPGINVPCYHDSETNLYLGLNIIADLWQEEKMIQVAHAYEQQTNWNSWVH